MGSAAERIPSFAELYRAIEALPAGLTGEILEPGVIRTLGRPGGPHRVSARAIWRSLRDDDRWEGGQGWWLEQEAEVRFGERLAVPDLLGWRVESVDPVPPAFIFENPIVELPNWCCEVLSPSTEKTDRELKVPLYAQAGVGWIWLVDPQARKAEILKVVEGKPSLVEIIEGDVKRTISPFTSLIDTSRWWVTRPG